MSQTDSKAEILKITEMAQHFKDCSGPGLGEEFSVDITLPLQKCQTDNQTLYTYLSHLLNNDLSI